MAKPLNILLYIDMYENLISVDFKNSKNFRNKGEILSYPTIHQEFCEDILKKNSLFINVNKTLKNDSWSCKKREKPLSNRYSDEKSKFDIRNVEEFA